MCARNFFGQLLLVAGCTTLLGCGGGGGSEAVLPFFGGVYRVSFAIIDNTCDFQQEPFSDLWTVNQLEDEIVVDSRFGVYVGSPIGPDSFAVTRSFRGECVDGRGRPVPSSTAAVTDTYEVTEITDSSALVLNTFIVGNCSGNTVFDSSCRFLARGSAVREQP